MGLFNSVKTPDNTTHTVSLPYGYCETAAGTAAKTVTVPNVSELTTGLAIIVRFKNSNSASSPTLNVNGLGAKNIYRYGTTKASTSTTVSGWTAGAVQLFVYNGSGWVRDYWSNTTYTNAALGQGFVICDTDAATAAKTCSISSYALADGGIVAIQFTNGNTASSPTLNITEKGAKPIYYNGAVINDDTFIQAGDICTFMYDSTSGAYHLLANDRWYKDIQTLAEDKMDKTNPVGYGTLSINRRDSSVTDDSSIAIGWNTSAMGSGSFAEGTSTKAVGTGSHAEGYSSSNTIDNVSDIANPGEVIDTWQDNKFLLARGNGSHAEGYDTLAYSTSTPSHAEGYKTVSKGGYGSHSEGYQTWATEMASHAEGMSTTASGEGAHAEGVSASASGQGAHAEGTGTSASSSGSHAEGSSTSATGSASHAEGSNTVAEGIGSHAEGDNTTASGNSSHAEGDDTIASGIGSHAEGQGKSISLYLTGSANSTSYTVSKKTNSIKIGRVLKYNNIYTKITNYDSSTLTITTDTTLSSTALSEASVELLSGVASGKYSHAEGKSTTASGNNSHAEGYSTIASGSNSHAEGYSTIASGSNSHAEGGNTIASGTNSHVQGKWNIEDTEDAYAHIVGNGESVSSRSNAHTLDWNGNAWFKGEVKIGGTGQDDPNAKKLATVDDIPQSDWNQNDENAADYIKNRPFGEKTVMGDTLTWNGNTEGLVAVTWSGHDYYKVSSATPTIEQLNNGFVVDGWDNCSISEIANGIIMLDFPRCIIVSANGVGVETQGGTFSEPGVYFQGGENHISSLKINGFNGFPTTGIDYLDPKYIKDMYYTGDPVETFIVEETNIILEEDSEPIGLLTAFQPLEVGQEYIVTIDGVQYNAVCKNANMDGMNMPYLGNANIALGGEDTGETFFIAPTTSETELGVMNTAGTLEYTVSVTYMQSEIHHIDPKYIKDMYYKEVYDVEPLPQSSLLFGTGIFDDILLPTPLITGSSYTVNWNGVEYECIAESYEENQAYIMNKDVPFSIKTWADGEECYTYMETPGTGSFNISIYNNTDSVEVLPETSVEIEDCDVSRYDVLTEMLVEGSEYTVNWDGIEYKCIAKLTEWGDIYLGDPGIDGYESSESNEPFYITSSSDGYNSIMPIEEGTHNVHITGVVTKYHTIDRQYLPVLVGASGTGENSEIFNDYRNNVASGNYSHAEGYSTTASGQSSHAEGWLTTASGIESHAEGLSTIASGDYSHAEGRWTTASGDHSHAEGLNTIASGYYSHAEGDDTIASGIGSHAEGQGKSISLSLTGNANSTSYKVSSNNDNIKIGRVLKYNDIYVKITNYDSSTLTITTDKTLSRTNALSNTSVDLVLGIASGQYSHAEGSDTTASGYYSHAEGDDTIASSTSSHAEGSGTIASGGFSHAEGGNRTKASGDYSHAEGSNTTASGYASHAEGSDTKATGKYSHAEGEDTEATASASHAGGCGTIASGADQTVIGRYNIADTQNTYGFIVGNGTAPTNTFRKNAFTVDWSGNGVFSGGITATNFNGYTIEKSVPSDAKFTDTTYSAATTSANGLMTSAMVTKLNGITAGAQPNVVTAVETAGAGSGGKAVITMADGTKWYFPTLVAGSGTIATTWLPTATSSASGIVKVGSNITVSSGTISLTKSNVTSALGYTPTNKEFIFDTYSKSVTINPGDQSVTVGALTQRSGYTLLGYINQNGGYTDQWLVSYGTYGSNVVAMVHSKYSGTLTQTISCTAIWYKNQ